MVFMLSDKLCSWLIMSVKSIAAGSVGSSAPDILCTKAAVSLTITLRPLKSSIILFSNAVVALVEVRLTVPADRGVTELRPLALPVREVVALTRPGGSAS
jgi:hypothetical protein